MTSPTTLYTAQRVISLAYQDAGLIQDGDEPNSEQYAKALLRVTDLVNMWQTQGLKLWLNYDLSVTLTAGVGTYTMGSTGSIVMTKPLRAIQGYYLDANNIRRPLVVLSREEYTRLSTPTQTGQINSYFVDKQQNLLSVSFWLVPDATAATGTAHLIIQQQVTGPVALTSDMGFPIEWYMALRWGLADELATGQPQSIMARCEQKAMAYRQALEDWDVEDASTTFTPDQRTQYVASGFR